MDVTVMSGVTDRNTVQVLMHTMCLCVLFICFVTTVFVQESVVSKGSLIRVR